MVALTMNGILHHVELNVMNLKRSKAFYDWLLPQLGYVLYQEWPQGFSYKLNETYLVFVEVEPPHRRKVYHRRAVGLNHLAFHTDKALIETIMGQLALKGIPILYPDRHPYAAGPDAYALFFEDPDRIKIELAAY